MSDLRQLHFIKGANTRALKRIWDTRHSIGEDIEDLSIGRSGGLFKKSRRKQGQNFANYVSHGVRRTIDKEGEKTNMLRGILSNLRLVYNKVRESFENWRLAGHYVDRGDLLFELLDQCNKRLSLLRAILSPTHADKR